MTSLKSAIWKILASPPREYVDEKSPKLLATSFPARLSTAKFSLPSSEYSSSSSSSSTSSSSMFWQSPHPPSHWSPKRYVSTKYHTWITKRQLAVVVCLALALFVWIVPSPMAWRKRVVHIDFSQTTSSPYSTLRPINTVTKKTVPDPLIWLDQNSNNRHSISTKSKLFGSLPNVGQASTKPRAALISLVRNSELPGLIQSMRQLEYHWNRKYQYPWIFFNDEPFSDEFKVRYTRIS